MGSALIASSIYVAIAVDGDTSQGTVSVRGACKTAQDTKNASRSVFPECAATIRAAGKACAKHIAVDIERDTTKRFSSVGGRVEAMENAKRARGTVFPKGSATMSSTGFACPVNIITGIELDASVWFLSVG